MDVDVLARWSAAGLALLAICEVMRGHVRYRWGVGPRARELFNGARVTILTFVGCGVAVIATLFLLVYALRDFRM